VLLGEAAETCGEDTETLRLGMRLYFVATLGPGQQESFRHDLLRNCLTMAARLLKRSRDAVAVGAGDLSDALDRHRRGHTYVDPYRLTCSLLGRGRPAPDPGLLSAVYL
jgi:streptomycin 6-kinase